MFLGGPLAAIAPDLAALHFEPVWMKYLAYGPLEEARKSANLLAIGTGVLVPLLGSTKTETCLPIAKTFAVTPRERHDAVRLLADRVVTVA